MAAVVIDAIFGLFIGVLRTALSSVLPVGGALPFTVPTGLLSGYTYLNAVAPLAEMVQVGVVYVAVLGIMIVVRTVLMIWSAIPGKFT